MGSVLVMGLQQAHGSPVPWWSGVVIAALAMASCIVLVPFAEATFRRLRP